MICRDNVVSPKGVHYSIAVVNSSAEVGTVPPFFQSNEGIIYIDKDNQVLGHENGQLAPEEGSDFEDWIVNQLGFTIAASSYDYENTSLVCEEGAVGELPGQDITNTTGASALFESAHSSGDTIQVHVAGTSPEAHLATFDYTGTMTYDAESEAFTHTIVIEEEYAYDLIIAKIDDQIFFAISD